DDLHPSRDRLEARLDHAAPLGVGELLRLTRDAEERDSVDARGDSRAEQPPQAPEVERAVRVERRGDDVVDADEACSPARSRHGLSSRWDRASSSTPVALSDAIDPRQDEARG